MLASYFISKYFICFVSKRHPAQSDTTGWIKIIFKLKNNVDPKRKLNRLSLKLLDTRLLSTWKRRNFLADPQAQLGPWKYLPWQKCPHLPLQAPGEGVANGRLWLWKLLLQPSLSSAILKPQWAKSPWARVWRVEDSGRKMVQSLTQRAEGADDRQM